MNILTQRIIDHKLPDIFTSNDLKRIEPENARRYQLIRDAVATGDIIRIRRGFYTRGKTLRSEPLNECVLANKLNPASYISLELALSLNNWIPEHVFAITCATSRHSYNLNTTYGRFLFVRLPQKKLFAGVQWVYLGDEPHVQAKPLKALADIIYERGYHWTSLEPLFESLRIEPEDLETLTATDFDEIQGNYEVPHVENFLAGIRKELRV
jgi:hypothetical protein